MTVIMHIQAESSNLDGIGRQVAAGPAKQGCATVVSTRSHAALGWSRWCTISAICAKPLQVLL